MMMALACDHLQLSGLAPSASILFIVPGRARRRR